jgi:hypothetical protein
VKFDSFVGELGPDGNEGHSGMWVVVVEIAVGRTSFGSEGDDKGTLNSLSLSTLSFSTKSYTHTRAPSPSFSTDPSVFGLDEVLTPSLFSCHSLTRALSLFPLP